MSGIINSVGAKSGIIGTTELDYEEGTWTPTFANSSVNPAGQYIKVGNLVYISCQMASIGSTAGGSSIEGDMGGLPFTPTIPADFALGYVYQIDWPASAKSLGVRVLASATTIYMQWSRDDLATLGVVGTDFDHANAQINFSGCYTV